MRLTKEFVIKDILRYELDTGFSIIDELQQGSLFMILDLIKLGNKCDDAEAESILNKALEEMSYSEVVEQLAYELIGKKPDTKDNVVDENEYTTFSDILNNFYNEIQSVDGKLSLSEFHNMNTDYMYIFADGIQQRYINNKNREMQAQYTNVVMFMSALTGKLKECPVLDQDGSLHKKTLLEKIKEIKSTENS